MIYTKPISIIPDNDGHRLEKLYEYQILDTHSEDTFDKISLLAAQLFNTTNAFITFVDEDRVFFKSNLSFLPDSQVDRRDSFCSLAILNDNVTVFNDTHTIPDFADNPFVHGKDGIRFYAGAPLRTPEGFLVGTICVLDTSPRQVSDMQIDMLKTLAKIVIDKLENRLRARKAIEAQIELMNIALHEIKNPLASINLANDIIKKDATKTDTMTQMISASVKRIQTRLVELIKQSEKEENQMSLSIEEINLHHLFERLVSNFELLAQKKHQYIELDCETLPFIDADKAKISDVLHNLLSNAIKYSYPNSTIRIMARDCVTHVEIEIKDQGQGLDEKEMDMLFTKFAKLSSKPTGRETSNGLGLSITKSFVELHKGTIKAVSEGKNKGTSFIVSLPVKFKSDTQEIFS